MLTASRQRFDVILNNILAYHPESNIVIDQKRDTRILVVDNKKIAKTNSEINKMGKENRIEPIALGLLSSVKRSFSTYLSKHLDDLIPDETREYTFRAVPKLNSPIYTNRAIFNQINLKDEFFIVDLRHAYWRIAYLKGYISDKLYAAHTSNKENGTKLWRNMALACTIAHKKRIYYIDGEPILEVSEVCKPYETMYQNIRHTCYNAVGDVQRALQKQVFALRTDAVFVTAEGLEKAKKMLYNRGFLCVVIKCVKISETMYRKENDEVKVF